jgi:hypothetical protein
MGPTIIGAGQKPAPVSAPKPTVMPISDAKPKPTSMPAGTPVAQKPPAPIPTALVPKPAPVVTTPVVKIPSAMHGTVRKGIEVSLADLKQGLPELDVQTLDEVRRFLASIVVDVLDDGDCVRWETDVQMQFSHLTDESVKVLQSAAIQSAITHLTRLNVLLGEIHEAFEEGKGGGMFSSWRRSDPRHEYDERKDEINQLRMLLQSLYPQVLEVIDVMTSSTTSFDALEHKLVVRSCAARYLSDIFVRLSRERAAEAMMSRGVSLMQTVSNIKQGNLMRTQTVASYRHIAERIQNVVLNELPAWVQAVTVVFQQAQITKTDQVQLRTGLDTILQRLK